MKEIILSQNRVALVDDADYEWLSQYKWSAAKNAKTYYAVRIDFSSGEGKTVTMHRLILDPPSGLETDHIDGNGLNNMRSNLRLSTSQQNKFNRRPFGKSKYTGVAVWYRNGHRYIRASICQDRQTISLGLFPTEEAAALAYNEAALKHRGEYARLNVIETIEP